MGILPGRGRVHTISSLRKMRSCVYLCRGSKLLWESGGRGQYPPFSGGIFPRE